MKKCFRFIGVLAIAGSVHWTMAANLPISAHAVTLDLDATDVRAVLKMLADEAGLNLVLSEQVQGQVSLQLQAVPWEQGLELVLGLNKLMHRRMGNVLWVMSRQEWLDQQKQHVEAGLVLTQAQPLQLLPRRLLYARASDVAKQLQGAGGKWLSARGTVMAEPRTNQLFVSDVPDRVQAMEHIINALDVPVRQVVIEARILEADSRFGESLGVKLGAGLSVPLSVGGKTGRGQLGGALMPEGAGVSTLPQSSFPATGAGQAVYAPASVAVSLFNAAADRFINLEISALESQGKGQVISRPRVVTADQTPALIEQGTEIPYQTSSGNTGTSTTFRKANLKLEVTPQITPEGDVIMDVDVNRDSVGQLTQSGYTINTKHVKTQVRVENGGTVVLGGIYEKTQNQDQTGVPGLSQVPVLGWLFKGREQVDRHTELLVFLTPKVVAERAELLVQPSTAGEDGPAPPEPPSR
ncbi:type IV pilus secretin PilQ [Limnohabitans sp.]|uniref:type IV pilus secretin PilQ n=1 Tax=Limnohabitans sp. TaxID=1907725 RepID=UPI00312023AB